MRCWSAPKSRRSRGPHDQLAVEDAVITNRAFDMPEHPRPVRRCRETPVRYVFNHNTTPSADS